jgi:hypothetical protein
MPSSNDMIDYKTKPKASKKHGDCVFYFWKIRTRIKFLRTYYYHTPLRILTCNPVTPTLQFCTSALVTTNYGKLKSDGLQWHVKNVFATYKLKISFRYS